MPNSISVCGIFKAFKIDWSLDRINAIMASFAIANVTLSLYKFKSFNDH